jgi:addiction module HigA family antidote
MKGDYKGFWAVDVATGGSFSGLKTTNRMTSIWSTITEKRDEPMTMKNPPHPGEVVQELCIEPVGLTVTAAAEVLGVSRKALSDLLNGHTGISPEMAVRLSKAFGGSFESWLTQQMQYDLARVRLYEPA